MMSFLYPNRKSPFNHIIINYYCSNLFQTPSGLICLNSKKYRLYSSQSLTSKIKASKAENFIFFCDLRQMIRFCPRFSSTICIHFNNRWTSEVATYRINQSNLSSKTILKGSSFYLEEKQVGVTVVIGSLHSRDFEFTNTRLILACFINQIVDTVTQRTQLILLIRDLSIIVVAFSF